MEGAGIVGYALRLTENAVVLAGASFDLFHHGSEGYVLRWDGEDEATSRPPEALQEACLDQRLDHLSGEVFGQLRLFTERLNGPGMVRIFGHQPQAPQRILDTSRVEMSHGVNP